MYQDERKRYFTFPKKILLTEGEVSHAELLLREGEIQPALGKSECATLRGRGAGVLLDYGRELHGAFYVASHSAASEERPGLWTNAADGSLPKNRHSVRLRVSCGESASEAMAHLGEKNATNDHAVRDGEHEIACWASFTTGETAFRFVYIELLEEGYVELQCACAVLIVRELPEIGAFRSDDEEVNRIWETAAYTVKLNLQHYLWDGPKRDRLVWVGDMHTEILTAIAAFGNVDVAEKSLDFMNRLEGDGWMNGFITYSMWWILCRFEIYMQTGDIAPVRQWENYLKNMLAQFDEMPESRGEKTGRWLFLDWPTQSDPDKTFAGIYGLLCLSFLRGAVLLRALGEEALADRYERKAAQMAQHSPDPHGHKGATALLALSGVIPADAAASAVAKDGAHGFSTFMGFYLLSAMAEGGKTAEALLSMKQYWGGMLSLGATSFWEDFDLDWMEGASPIDRLPTEGEKDIHGDFGGYCYRGFRHSLCHGWSSGPCPFLTKYVLGIRPLTPGCRRVAVKGELGHLQFAEGTYPTPYGPIHVSHRRLADGTVETAVDAPDEIEIVKE